MNGLIIPPNITQEGIRAGHQAEDWAATLPNMGKIHRGYGGPYDLIQVPSNAKVEVKFSQTRVLEDRTFIYDDVERFLWKDIQYERFDWLLLIGKYLESDRYCFWLESQRSALLLLTVHKRGGLKRAQQII